jgi:hypothetical protein
MKNRIQLDPFRYGKLDVVTTLVQIATVVAGIVLAVNGNTAGLLALGALAGGGKGTLVGDMFRKVAEELSRPNAKKKRGGFIRLPLLVIVAAVVVHVAGCGIDKQFVIDSRKAILTEAGDYLMGCEQATIAPAFSIDWNDNVTYGGGVFAGCEVEGRLLRFHCEAYQDSETGKTSMKCEPLSIWERREEDRK